MRSSLCGRSCKAKNGGVGKNVWRVNRGGPFRANSFKSWSPNQNGGCRVELRRRARLFGTFLCLLLPSSSYSRNFEWFLTSCSFMGNLDSTVYGALYEKRCCVQSAVLGARRVHTTKKYKDSGKHKNGSTTNRGIKMSLKNAQQGGASA